MCHLWGLGLGSELGPQLGLRLGLGLGFIFCFVRFYQAYCTLVVHYCYVTVAYG